MKKNMVYFVLYIVLISELLMVIVERDDLLEQEEQVRDKMLTTIAESYKKPVLLNIPELFSVYDLKSKEPKKIVMTPLGLVSDTEKKNIQYFIDVAKSSKKTPPNWPENGITVQKHTKNYFIKKNPDGSAIFNAKFTSPGKYTFTAYFKTKRALPDYLPDFLKEELKNQIGEHIIAQSPPVEFTIHAKRMGGVQKKEVEFSF